MQKGNKKVTKKKVKPSSSRGKPMVTKGKKPKVEKKKKEVDPVTKRLLKMSKEELLQMLLTKEQQKGILEEEVTSLREDSHRSKAELQQVKEELEKPVVITKPTTSVTTGREERAIEKLSNMDVLEIALHEGLLKKFLTHGGTSTYDLDELRGRRKVK